MVKLADTRDLKSLSGDRVRVRPPSAASESLELFVDSNDFGLFLFVPFSGSVERARGIFREKGGVSLVRNRDLRPAAKANPTIQQAFERFQKYNRLKNLSQGSLDFYAAKGRSFFRFLGDTEQPIHTITEETVEDYIF